MREPRSLRRELGEDTSSDEQDPEPSSSGQFKIGEGDRQSRFEAHAELAPESNASAWTNCSSDYQLFAAGATRPFAWDAVRLVRIESGSLVLDVATGTGEFAMAATERGADVLATDFSPSMLELLQQTRSKRGVGAICTAEMDGQSLALPENTFDVAGSLFGLVFFPNPEKGLSEMYRVLKPGGQTVIATWANPARVELMRLVGETILESCFDMEVPAARSSDWTRFGQPAKLRQLLAGVGFAAVHVVELSHVWTFECVEEFSRAVLRTTPTWLELYQCMNHAQKRAFAVALARNFRRRQGNGPFAVTAQGLIAVGTKPLG